MSSCRYKSIAFHPLPRLFCCKYCQANFCHGLSAKRIPRFEVFALKVQYIYSQDLLLAHPQTPEDFRGKGVGNFDSGFFSPLKTF